MANDVLSMWTPVNAESMNAENLFNQLHLQQSSSYETNGVTTYYLDSVYAALGELQIYSSENSGQLLSSWQYWTEGSK